VRNFDFVDKYINDADVFSAMNKEENISSFHQYVFNNHSKPISKKIRLLCRTFLKSDNTQINIFYPLLHEYNYKELVNLMNIPNKFPVLNKESFTEDVNKLNKIELQKLNTELEKFFDDYDPKTTDITYAYNEGVYHTQFFISSSNSKIKQLVAAINLILSMSAEPEKLLRYYASLNDTMFNNKVLEQIKIKEDIEKEKTKTMIKTGGKIMLLIGFLIMGAGFYRAYFGNANVLRYPGVTTYDDINQTTTNQFNFKIVDEDVVQDIDHDSLNRYIGLRLNANLKNKAKKNKNSDDKILTSDKENLFDIIIEKKIYNPDNWADEIDNYYNIYIEGKKKNRTKFYRKDYEDEIKRRKKETDDKWQATRQKNKEKEDAAAAEKQRQQKSNQTGADQDPLNKNFTNPGNQTDTNTTESAKQTNQTSTSDIPFINMTGSKLLEDEDIVMEGPKDDSSKKEEKKSNDDRVLRTQESVDYFDNLLNQRQNIPKPPLNPIIQKDRLDDGGRALDSEEAIDYFKGLYDMYQQTNPDPSRKKLTDQDLRIIEGYLNPPVTMSNIKDFFNSYFVIK
jgi:hypothetical protein